MEEKRNKHTFLLVFAIFILLISFIGFIISLNMNSFVILQEEGIPIAVSISNYTALNVSKNQTELHLGTIMPGYAGQRNLKISNSYDFKTAFEFDITGDIAPLIIYPKVVFLDPNETREVTFSTKMPENESLGTYTGIINIKIKRVP